MTASYLSRLINWRLWALHQLALFCLTIGARQLLVIRDWDVAEAYLKYGNDAFLHLSPNRHESPGAIATTMLMREPLAGFVATIAACSLSWLIVTNRQERRAIPVLVFLVNLLLQRLGVYGANWLWNDVMPFLKRPLNALDTVPTLWITGTVFVGAGLLLLLRTWPFRRPMAGSALEAAT